MTLNLTVVTPTRIYQSADYRLYDIGTRVCADFRTQKLLLVNAGNWSATIAFAGIGRVGSIDVREWLVDRVRAVQMDDPIDRLYDELLTANEWIAAAPPELKRHSFGVGAFVESQAVFTLVSNHEELWDPLNHEVGDAL